MNKFLYAVLLVLVSFGSNAASSNFTACKSTYALCTTALCDPLPGKAGFANCACQVKTGYSAGTKPCTGIIKTKAGKAVSSRYYPVKDYVRCSNNRLWAFCLDSPCVIDPENPEKASCICSLVKDKGDYVVITDDNTKTSCTTGIYSSATIDDINQITAFLKQQPQLQPFPLEVLNKK